jgi:hypothetical protein
MTPSGTDKLDAAVARLRIEIPADLPDDWDCIVQSGDIRQLIDAIEQLREERSALMTGVRQLQIEASFWDGRSDRHTAHFVIGLQHYREEALRAIVSVELSAETLRRQQAEERVAGLEKALRAILDDELSDCRKSLAENAWTALQERET